MLHYLHTIKMLTGEIVSLVVEAIVTVKHRGQQQSLRVVVTQSGPSLLSKNGLEQLNLNWAEIKQLKMQSHLEATEFADNKDSFIGVRLLA